MKTRTLKIFKASVCNNAEGWTISYHPTRRDALQEVRNAVAVDPQNMTGSVEEIAFNPTKYGIVNMLNNRTPSHDNG